MTETKRLGRGLEALLGPVSREQAEASGALRELPLSSIKPNPYQPRTRMDPAELSDLASSMEASGLLQPVVVRPHDNGFELIAGERRWRAAQQLGWPRIPAVVKEVDDRTLLTLALIENLQRDDLSPIDEAAGYRRLGEEFQLGHSEIAKAVGRDRSTVANLLRLLQLPPDVQTQVHEKRLSAGHARALLGLSDTERQSALAIEAVEQGWSVREVEAADGAPESLAAIVRLGVEQARSRGRRRCYAWLPRATCESIPDWSIRIRRRRRAIPMLQRLDGPDEPAELDSPEAAFIPYLDQF